MTLLQEIQNMAVDSNSSITALLRKCLLLSAKLDSYQFRKWVEAELNGYGEKEVPDYRIGNLQSFGAIFNGVQLRQREPLPTFLFSKMIQKHIEGFNKTINPISVVEDLVNNRKQDSTGSLEIEWPGNMIALINSDSPFAGGFVLQSAWSETSVGYMVSIVDAVRNRILSFVIEIEVVNPDAGEAEPNSQPMPPDQTKQIFYMTIMGNVGNVSAGSSGFSQTSTITLESGNLESLIDYLREQGIEDSDLQELSSAIKDDESTRGDKSFGDKAKQWLADMAMKVASKASDASIEKVSQAIMAYFGIS